ncbi:MAG: hypothetical protein SNI72_06120 [Rikenellaceae bacterium]
MKNFLLLLLMLLPLVSVGQSVESTPREELRVVERLYYLRGVYVASEEERSKLTDLIAGNYSRPYNSATASKATSGS